MPEFDALSVLPIAAMNVLDGDEVRLSSRGRYAERDIVQVGVFKVVVGNVPAGHMLRLRPVDCHLVANLTFSVLGGWGQRAAQTCCHV